MTHRPYRDEQALAWELREYWVKRKPVALRLSRAAAVDRVHGYVCDVAPTGAFARVVDAERVPITIPLWAVLSVRTPHFHEPLDNVPLPPRPERRPPLPGQLRLISAEDE